MPNAKKKGVFFAVLVLFAINILNFYDRHVPGALVEPMRREFHLSDMQIGLLGSVFIWLYAIMGVPLGRIADSGSRKKLLAWGLVVWASLTACAAIATNFSILLISRVGVGLGEATCAPAATSWLGDLFPADKRSRVLALFMLGVPFGGALAYFSSGPLAQAHVTVRLGPSNNGNLSRTATATDARSDCSGGAVNHASTAPLLVPTTWMLSPGENCSGSVYTSSPKP